ncbi:MAG: amidohydrolase family protein [Paracoccaceae bacterium]
MKIDAHQHFWSIARGDYGWLTPELTAIYRDFGPDDLTPHLKAQKIDGTVLVQAAPTLAETQYMLAIADSHDVVKGVVGWVDFESPDASVVIARLAQHPKLVALRPMIQDIDDTDWMLRPDLAPAFEAMIAHDLAFDALTLPRHLANLRQLIERHPKLRVVVDHGSKPEIHRGEFAKWAAGMTIIANETNASVKLSGLVTEAGPSWTAQDIQPYAQFLLDHFGPSRVIWGSDWPVCTLASSYARWCDVTDQFLVGFDDAERAAVLGLNAVEFYQLERPS